ncbi:MAG: hemerythrin domain-containing protein [Myxococcales bacterium]|nr:hemerythrin domain-containing protein [Myxococcales bacterium]MDH3845095.1 hemerythrin domain-containing protein [Myxococcales bacterium]
MMEPSSKATPDEIRKRIRSEHYRIAEQLARVEALTDEASRGDPATIIALRQQLQTLGTTLHDHLHYEEYSLPSLTQHGKAADEAAEMMRREHQAQRELLDGVIHDLDETAVGEKLVVGVRELARAIRDDMEHEERELLSKPQPAEEPRK